MTLHDNYYDLDTISVEGGETVRFVLKNEGALLHEFNIGTSKMHEGHQAEMVKMMEHGMMTPTGMNHDMAGIDHGSMPGMEGMSHNDPNSVLVGPGETGELIWTFSGDAELQYACNMPGHYQAGMVGEFKHD
ncbi:cupredoxin domain-containing protein [Marinobacterium aestuariivivens]|uniref:Plastocyanin/azurin family copper-binding protein n=1 Tax=Marinobacterium aestuariivivens TaxID=1698799 RepID=A0ABW2A7H2_9GAMM